MTDDELIALASERAMLASVTGYGQPTAVEIGRAVRAALSTLLEQRVLLPRPEWTTERPTVGGLYFFRGNDKYDRPWTGDPRVEVFRTNDNTMLYVFCRMLNEPGKPVQTLLSVVDNFHGEWRICLPGELEP